MGRHITLPSGLVALLLAASAFAQDGFDTPLKPFLQKHCLDCHDSDGAKGGLDLEKVPTDLADPAALARWIHVYDRVAAGEMPPRKKKQPAAAEKTAFTRSLGDALTRAHAARKGTVLRRLNRIEYENTLNDLFGTHAHLAEMLPEDGRSHEFDNVGEALGISMVQLKRYMEGARAVLDEAIVSGIAPPKSAVKRSSYADTREGKTHIGKSWHKLKDGAVVFYRSGGYPSGMLRDANVRTRGRYKVRVTGYAHQSDTPVTFLVGATSFARGSGKPTFGYFAFKPGKPQTIELEAWIEDRYMIRIEPFGIHDAQNLIKKNGIAKYPGPGLAILHVELEGPLVDEYPSRGHHLVFDGLDRREIMPRNPNERKKSWYKPKFEVVTDTPGDAATTSLKRVAAAAFRRPVTDADIAPYRVLFERELGQKATFEEALRAALTAVLCAPNFLYLLEKPGPLDDHALASRLSYFLARTGPDAELLRAAASGKLTRDPAVLRAQTERLLQDPRADRFFADFTDAWLNLRDIDFTAPDAKLFPEFDPYLRYSMVLESRAFLAELIRSNLGARNIVRSDFAMLNDRLAAHYGIDGVTGSKLRKVALPPGSVRGGFLSQCSVLKVSANGTNTSPVVRGVWVLERILGTPPKPPPPGIPGVEPDIRGATTLREILDKHRSMVSCNGCHSKIDPPGFALEGFNPIGGERERFRSLGKGDRINTLVRGRKVNYRMGPPVDSSGALPTGESFKGFNDFRALLLKDEKAIAKAFVKKLLVFATGREMGFSDRAEIDRIVAAAEPGGYGIRDLVHRVVASGIFRNK